MIPARRAPGIPALLLALVAPAFGAGAGIFNVRDDGASGDGSALCTIALQRTIDRCAAAGGGTVAFPAGTYLSGTLTLKSNVTLHLEAGATLRGSADGKDYPAQRSAVRSYTDNYVQQALIFGENLDRVGLTGRGTIDGNGDAFHWKEYLNRPYVIRLVNCRDVLVEGLTLRSSPMWMQHYLACDRVRIHGLRVFNHGGYNNDGLDLDACHDVTISDCTIDSDDDALCLKSTLNRACENVTITNCVLSSHANAFKLGTESNGGFKRITFTNSVILSPRFTRATYGIDRGMGGIALESVDGGALEDITVSHVSITGVNVPIFLRLGNRARPFERGGPTPPIGTFRNVNLSDIIATRAGRIGCSITGLAGHRVENVTLSNISLEFEGGGKREAAGKIVAERPEAYPESRMFGELPAYGVFARHVQGLRLRDVRVSTLAPDARHAFVADDVRDLELAGLRTDSTAGSAAVVRLTDVTDADVRDCRPLGAAEVFLAIEGDATRRVALIANDLTRVERPIDRAKTVPAAAVRESANLVRPTP